MSVVPHGVHAVHAVQGLTSAYAGEPAAAEVLTVDNAFVPLTSARIGVGRPRWPGRVQRKS